MIRPAGIQTVGTVPPPKEEYEGQYKNYRRGTPPRGLLWFPQEARVDIYPIPRSLPASPTIKDCPAVLGGRGQRQAGGVKLVSVVPNADLELDGIIHILQHCG